MEKSMSSSSSSSGECTSRSNTRS